MTSARAAYGLTLTWNGQTVAEISSVGRISRQTGTIDATHYTSTDHMKEFIAGFREGGELTITGNFIPSDTNGQIAMFTDEAAGTVREVVITEKDSAFSLTFDAMITDIGLNPPLEGKWEFEATLKPSGTITLGVTQEDQLSALSLTTATLYPSFGAAVYEYVATTTGTSFTVTPTCAGADSIEVWADGSLVSSPASGDPSSAIAITTAARVDVEVRCKGTGKVDRIYKISVVKTA